MACFQCARQDVALAWEWKGRWYCKSCWNTSCDVCGGWDVGDMLRVSDTCDALWQCEHCVLLSAGEQRELKSFGRVLECATFSVWEQDTRERANIRQTVPVPQPGAVRPWLCIGDLDDVCKLADGSLPDCRISRVLLLCKNYLFTLGDVTEDMLTAKLSEIGVNIDVMDAHDWHEFDIVAYARKVAAEVGADASSSGRRVLVNCYGGINRAAAVSVMMLMLVEKLPLLQAVADIVGARGTVLTNIAFRRQLVLLASELGLLSTPAADVASSERAVYGQVP